jgi:gliding motility-associated-like protein
MFFTMRKVFYALLLLLSSTAASAQWAQVTHLSGTVTVAGTAITVTSAGSASSIGYCGTGPYWIGANSSTNPLYGQYTYNFSPAVSAVRAQITAMSWPGLEVDSFFINGVFYPITAANLSTFLGTCNQTQAPAVNGLLQGPSVTTPVGTGAEVIINPGVPITSFRISTNGSSNGNVWNMYIDSGFAATNNGPVCAGDTLKLFASAIPGATYSWTGPNSFSSNLQNPVIPNVTAAAAGSYIATATSASGVKIDTTIVTVLALSPLPVVTSPVTYCLNAPAIPLTATGTSLLWYTSATGGTGSTTAPTPSTASVGSTTYYVSQQAQGLCRGPRAPITVTVAPQPGAVYTYAIRYGCTADTVDFTSAPVQPSGVTYRWDFGDGSATDTARNPTHIYTPQGVYTVKLVVTSGNACRDSTQQQIDLQHPLVASFTQSADSFCQGGTVTFTNTSQTTIRNGIAPRYLWNFGDGSTDTAESPTHIYTRAGVWPVLLTVRDFVPCTDTASSVVVIDSIPFVNFTASDSTLCEGQAVTFNGDFLQLNNTGYTWNFGDGSTEVVNRNPATHGYEAAGTYTVTLTASYRICPDTAVTRDIIIRPYTSINIGPDTSICPNGEPILLTARLSDGSLAPTETQVRWSTGDTASSILVRYHGDYWAVADVSGCTAADSVHIAKDCYLDLPNVFSPNGDGTNDYFWPRQLLSEGIVRFSMRIFNRWGQPVWETTRIDGRGWDGKFNGTDQPTGVYIYLVEAEFRNGIREKYQGNVTLLR